MGKVRWATFALLAVCSLATAQDEPKRGPSTPEERQRFLTLTHKLEQTPLDRSLNPDIHWALQWVEDIPDINVNICPDVLGGNFLESHYLYSYRVLGQVVLGNVAFLIEHPDKKNDQVAQYTAGIESALKAYKGMVRADPMHVSRSMEELLEKQNQGKLADFVRESSKECSTGEQTGF